MGQISYSCVFLCSISSGDGCSFPLDKSSGIAIFAGPGKCDASAWCTLGDVPPPYCTYLHLIVVTPSVGFES